MVSALPKYFLMTKEEANTAAAEYNRCSTSSQKNPLLYEEKRVIIFSDII
jgi:hypothetical protein